MALAIKDFVLYDDDNEWRDYYVLNSEVSQVYLITLDEDGVIQIEESDEAEDNPAITDEETDIKYYIAISESYLWLEEADNKCTLAKICSAVDELKALLEEARVMKIVS